MASAPAVSPPGSTSAASTSAWCWAAGAAAGWAPPMAGAFPSSSSAQSASRTRWCWCCCQNSRRTLGRSLAFKKRTGPWPGDRRALLVSGWLHRTADAHARRSHRLRIWPRHLRCQQHACRLLAGAHGVARHAYGFLNCVGTLVGGTVAFAAGSLKAAAFGLSVMLELAGALMLNGALVLWRLRPYAVGQAT